MKPEKPSLEVFIQNFEIQFTEMKKGTLTPETEFRQLREWSSIQSLVILASFHWDYDINLPAEEMRKAKTLGDLYQAILNLYS